MNLPTQEKSARFVLLSEGLDGQVGGVQRVSRSVMEALRSDPVRSWVWSANDSAGDGQPRQNPHVHTRCFGRNYRAMGLAALTAGDMPVHCERIFCWHAGLLPVGAILAWRLKCPLELFLHGVEVWGHWSLRRRWAMRWVGAVAANSRHTLERFRKAHPDFADRPGRVVALGLNAEFLAADAASAVFQRVTEPYFLTVTRLAESYKGGETLLRAFCEIHRLHPGVKLLCVGEGPSREHWEKEAIRLGLGNSVRFPGRVSDAELAGLYSGCLGFVLLSEGEGFGIVFLEAMYHGKPCIATNADASQEIVRDGVTGWATAPRDVEAVIGAMRKTIEDSALARHLGEAGRQMVLDRYMPQHFQQRLRDYMACV